jgi:response regulator RpfG family c-di-GMP phosphodiesterase
VLHDLGKIGVREAVLNKPGRLTEEEAREIERRVVKDCLRCVLPVHRMSL